MRQLRQKNEVRWSRGGMACVGVFVGICRRWNRRRVLGGLVLGESVKCLEVSGSGHIIMLCFYMVMMCAPLPALRPDALVKHQRMCTADKPMKPLRTPGGPSPGRAPAGGGYRTGGQPGGGSGEGNGGGMARPQVRHRLAAALTSLSSPVHPLPIWLPQQYHFHPILSSCPPSSTDSKSPHVALGVMKRAQLNPR